MCIYVIRDKYRYFISRNESLDFYPYNQACDIINSFASPTDCRDLRNYVLETLRGHTGHCDSRTHARYTTMLERMRIHSYIMPRSMGNEVLVSPMTLLNERIEQLRLSRLNFIERYGETIPWPPDQNDVSATTVNEDMEEFINDVDLQE
jgi:hypothetical protein